MYQRIKHHISQIRQGIYNKLWELQILQKVNFANFNLLYKSHRRIHRVRSNELLYDYSTHPDEALAFPSNRPLVPQTHYPSAPTRNYVIFPCKECPDKYTQFLLSLQLSYVEFNGINIEGLELLCKDLLKSCQISQGPIRINIHKSLFSEKIMRDSVIRVLKRDIKRVENSEEREKISG